MAVQKENKVEFGLRNCYYAVATIGDLGKVEVRNTEEIARSSKYYI